MAVSLLDRDHNSVIVLFHNNVMEDAGLSAEENSRERILKAATDEFLQKGFQGASLRTIAREAGVTTGSFYWHFKNKEELFDAIAGEHYDYIMNLYRDALDRFFELPPEEQKERMNDITDACLEEMISYIYCHRTEFKLLIDCSDGTAYENMLHELSEAESESTRRFMEQMKLLGIEGRKVLPELEHILVSGMFTGIFELITHDVPEETARECVKGLHDFYTAGWMYLMNIPDYQVKENK